MKSHERWWEDNLNTRGADFRRWLEESDASSRQALYKFVVDDGVTQVLECGPGIFIDWQQFFSKTPWIDYEAIDITPKLVDLGRELGARCQVGSIEQLPYTDGSRELVYCRAVLEHLPNYREAISEMYRVASRLVICFMWKLTLNKHSKISFNQDKNAPGTYQNTYSRDELTEYAQSLGARVEWLPAGYPGLVLHKT